MTETSDSGFTETNQSRTSEGSQCDTKSGNSSPNSNSMEENNSLIACENSENLIMDAVGSEQEDVNGESSMINDDDTSSSSSSEESDEDYDESERNGHGKSSVFSWVSFNFIFWNCVRSRSIENAHIYFRVFLFTDTSKLIKTNYIVLGSTSNAERSKSS